MTERPRSWLRTRIGTSTSDSITVRGRSLTEELMGEVSFTDLSFLLATGSLPTDNQSRLLNAVLVSLADHGLTPSALAARLTYTGAPEAFQAAVAAGLLGAGSVFLGPTEDAARFLRSVVQKIGTQVVTDESMRGALANAVRARLELGLRIPGLGHPIHKQEDPRVPRLYVIAEENELLGPHLKLLRLLPDVAAAATQRRLPINGAGAAGAALADLGVPPELGRGFALLARTAGLVGQLAEEMSDPIGHQLFRDVHEHTQYESS